MAHDPPQHARAPLTIQVVQPQMRGGVALTSPAIDAEGRLDPIHSADGDNLSPALAWNPVLEAESFALVVEDPDAPRDLPFVHWLIWDIPGKAVGLPRGVAATPRLEDGAIQGRNDMGKVGWYGMKPPPGHGVHRYHFQLFALGKTLGMGPETTLKELLNALKANTVTSGEVIGTFLTPDPADLGSEGRSFARSGGDTGGRGGLDRDDPDRHAPHSPNGEVRR